MAFATQEFFWPIYFQSVKDVSARASGINLLPSLVSSSIATFSAGLLINKAGVYVPFMWAGAALVATGAGCFQLIHPYSSASNWISYQIISGLGFGMCTQIPILAVQTVLDKPDVPMGSVMVIFFLCLGGAMATGIGQNIFTSRLLNRLKTIDGVDGPLIIKAGANSFRKLVPINRLDEVLAAFNSALKGVFLFSFISAAIALTVSLGIEWKRVGSSQVKEPTARATETSSLLSDRS